MWRVVSALIAGAALGAGGTYYLLGGSERGAKEDVGASLNPDIVLSRLTVSPTAMPSPAAGGFSKRSNIYQLAADADPASLRSLIEEAAARPESAERRFLLATLLSRYAEFSPSEAIDLATDQELDRAIVAGLYGLWAGTDPEAALDAWTAVDNARDAHAIGLALFQAFGANEEAFSTVVTSLPQNLDADRFQMEVIGLWAETAPEAALRQTLSLQRRSVRIRALENLAEAWSEHDPRAALDALSWIDDSELQEKFEAAVLRQWSTFEPESAFEYIIGVEGRSRQSSGLANRALSGIARTDPLRALEFADRLSGQAARWGRHVVMRAWAVDDVAGALAYVENLSKSRLRQELRSVVARTYGRRDPEGAFAWAQNLKPSSPDVLVAVVDGIAHTDPGRAMDAVLSLDSEEAQSNAMMMITARSTYSGDPAALAGRLIALPEGRVKDQAMQTLTSNWSQADPESALKWLLANADQAGAEGFRQVSQYLGHTDPELAARQTSKVPPAHREVWIQSVADGYAQIDPAAALNWISQYQGEPAYEAGLAAIVQQSAQQDPRTAARMFGTIGDSPHAANAASAVADRWARSDPRAAAAWAEGIEQDQARVSAVSRIAQRWAGSDPQAAKRWVLELRSDSERDVALASLIQAIASKETPDGTLLTAFSSDTARNQALTSVVYRVAKRDPNAARRLIDEHISDEHTRRQAEQSLLHAQRNR